MDFLYRKINKKLYYSQLIFLGIYSAFLIFTGFENKNSWSLVIGLLAFSAFLFFLLTKFGIKAKFKTKNLNSYLKLLSIVIKNTENQFDYIKNKFEKTRADSKTVHKILNTLRNYCNDELTIKKSVGNLRNIQKQEKLQLIYEFIKISSIDTSFSAEDRTIIYEIAKELGITRQTVKKIENMFCFKNEYDDYLYYNKSNKSNKSEETYLNVNFLINSAYETLGLENSATNEEVKSKYRFLVKQYHPDTHKNYDDNDMFIAIQQAYELIEQEKNL